MRKRPLSKSLLNELKTAIAKGRYAVEKFAKEHKKELIAAGIAIPTLVAASFVVAKGMDIHDVLLDKSNMKGMTKEELIRKINKSMISQDKKQSMIKEVEAMSPSFIERSDIRKLKFTHMPFRFSGSIAGGYSPVTRKIILKSRHATPGALTHEMYHGSERSKNYPYKNLKEYVVKETAKAAEVGKKKYLEAKFQEREPSAYFAGQIARKRIGKKGVEFYRKYYGNLSLSDKKRIIRDIYG